MEAQGEGVELVQVDAFTKELFGGNPAAVCFLPAERGWPTDAWLQHFAAEMNLSETAFLLPKKGADNSAHYELRWLTPAVEVDLCGHATLGAAHALYETGRVASDLPIVFHTRKAGLLTVSKHQDWLQMDFPPEAPATVERERVPVTLFSALGVSEDQVVEVSKNKWDHVVELRQAETVRNLSPDFRSLGAIPDARCVVVTARGNLGDGDGSKPFDFISRVFAPAVGIDEDPVTGSAHCGLAPYWRERLQKSELYAYQASKRGGILRLGFTSEGRVLIEGQAVTVFKARLNQMPSY